jgi:diguanylate cyclase (GGDEF)-like protein
MKVLIVDDSRSARELIRLSVARAGHDAVVAGQGDEAWALYEASGADVVISDWLMPVMNGDELCRLVRNSDAHGYTYFILLTSLDDPEHLQQGMEAGADDYLRKPFDAHELQAKLISAARVTRLHTSLHTQQAELERLNSRLLHESRHDPLTGLCNRVALREQLKQLGARARRYGHACAVVLFDVDAFKVYNDTCGHLRGDDALKAVGQAIKDSCRDADVAFRYGGEELLVVLPEQRTAAAAIVAERMRRAVEALGIPHPGRGPDHVVTVSAGVAELDPIEEGDFDAALARADAALYSAKAHGRNRVECQTPGPAGPGEPAGADHL